jgi:riboflavin biosynthesis pyrimidine reductase
MTQLVRAFDADRSSTAELVELYPRAPRPMLRANFVASIDGAVAVEGLSTALSSPADKRVFRVLRMLCDAVLVGAGTLRDEGYRPLTLDADRRDWRVTHGLPPTPTLVVVSRSLRLDPAAPALAAAPVRPIVLATPGGGPPSAALRTVADVLPCADLPTGLALLHDRGLTQLLCEGGPTLFGALNAADLIDELCLTVAPLLAGPGAERIATGLPHPPRPLRATHALVSRDGTLITRYRR